MGIIEVKLLEVKKDGRTFMATEYEECIPSNDVLKSIKNAGYKIYINGKIWRDKVNGAKC